MFKVEGPILQFFPLVLTILPNFIPDDIYKRLKGFQNFLKKGSKITSEKEIFVCLIPQLVLVPAKADPAIKERSDKRYLIGLNGTSGSKIIFTLLAEIVILYLRFFHSRSPGIWALSRLSQGRGFRQLAYARKNKLIQSFVIFWRYFLVY